MTLHGLLDLAIPDGRSTLGLSICISQYISFVPPFEFVVTSNQKRLLDTSGSSLRCPATTTFWFLCCAWPCADCHKDDRSGSGLALVWERSSACRTLLARSSLGTYLDDLEHFGGRILEAVFPQE